MEDLYEQLISGAPQQAQIPAIVEQLRKRRMMGELGQLSGDKVLAPFGQNMSRQADSYAEQIQGVRQRDADNAQTKAYQDAQIAHQDAVLRQTMARDNATAEHQRRADEAARLRAEAAMERARKTGSARPLTPQVIKDLNDTRQQTDKITALKSSFKDEYARKGVPGGRTLSNTMARFGVGGKDDKEAFEWWRQFQMDFNILARNQMFGATLSTNEKSSWDRAVAGEEMTSGQIKDILGTMERWYTKNLDDKAATYAMSYNPEQVAVAIGKEPRAAQPAEDDIEDFFTLYDENPELAVETWNGAFPGIVNPAERPAQ